MTADILGADLLLRVGVDASGAAAEVTSKLTAAERAAVASGDRIGTAISKGNEKAAASQLRLVAATERYNRVLQTEKATIGQRASAQASLITAQQRYTTELARSEVVAGRVARVEKDRLGFLKATVAGAAGYAGAQGVLNLLRSARTAGVELQDVVSANASVFGRAAVDIDRFVRARGDALNLDPLAVQQQVQVLGGVFKGAGSSRQQSVQQALALTQRAADVRSLYGGSLSDVTGAFRSALVGETEPIRRYNVLLNDANLRQRALSMGLVESTKTALPPAIKAQAAYAEILAQTSDAQGDISRTADSAANKVEDQREKAAKLRQELGTGLLPAYTELLDVGTELAPVLVEVAKGISGVLGNDTARHAIEFSALAVAASKLGGALNQFVGRTTEKIRANTLLAGSYRAVAVEATTAAGAEARALAVPAGGGVAGGRYGGRGQMVALGALGLVATGAGALGGGQGRLLGNVASGAFTGAGLGSFIPGVGTGLGAIAGAGIGLGLSLLGPSDPVTTNRTPAQILAERRRVQARITQLQAAGRSGQDIPGVPNPVLQAGILKNRLTDLSKELEAARAQGKQTFATFDAGTGTFKKMTQSEITAAAASDAHTKAMLAERKAREDLIASFAVDPLSGAPDTKKALTPEQVLRRARATTASRADLQSDFRRLRRAGATREDLQTLYDIESQAPGTIDNLAKKGARRYVRELHRELRQQRGVQKDFANLFDGAESAAERAGRRAAKRLRQAFRSSLREEDLLRDFKQQGYRPGADANARAGWGAS